MILLLFMELALFGVPRPVNLFPVGGLKGSKTASNTTLEVVSISEDDDKLTRLNVITRQFEELMKTYDKANKGAAAKQPGVADLYKRMYSVQNENYKQTIATLNYWKNHLDRVSTAELDSLEESYYTQRVTLHRFESLVFTTDAERAEVARREVQHFKETGELPKECNCFYPLTP